MGPNKGLEPGATDNNGPNRHQSSLRAADTTPRIVAFFDRLVASELEWGRSLASNLERSGAEPKKKRPEEGNRGELALHDAASTNKAGEARAISAISVTKKLRRKRRNANRPPPG